jgi:hypothetical protein
MFLRGILKVAWKMEHFFAKESQCEGTKNALFRFTVLEQLKLVLPEWAKEYDFF